MTLILKIEDGPRTISWPVTAQEPVDGGKLAPRSFKATFEIIGDEEFGEILRLREGSDNALVKRVLRDWDGVVDADKAPIPCSDEVVDHVVENLVWLRTAIAKAYLAAHTGATGKN
jgi:hypothetical protein